MTQSQALQILKTGANIFLTGEPGSGKTHVINEYIVYLRSQGIKPAVTASTGIAATHIGGMTIHSWSGIGIKTNLDKYALNKIASNKHVVGRIRRTKVLIIDEVSMLSPEILFMVDKICCEIKQNSNPFGGIQIVLVGDFFQLPPVMTNKEKNNASRALTEESFYHFAYDSSAWKRANLIVCYLAEQYRQSDIDFLNLLSAIRNNAFGNDHFCRIETRKVEQHTEPSGIPKLFPHNFDVDNFNNKKLSELPGKSRIFTMFSQGSDASIHMLKKSCPSPEVLHLKVKALVMFTKNNLKEGFVNGTFGTVEDFDKSKGYPIIKMRNGIKIMAQPMEWTIEESGKIYARAVQLPLRLAWAITVHKSQGMSLDEAVVDLSNVFEFGQGYVALSRVRRFSGLYLLGWNKRAFQVHPEVSLRDVKFRAQSEQVMCKFSMMTETEIALMHEQFIRSCKEGMTSEDRIDLQVAPLASSMAHKYRNIRGERRWGYTLAMIQSGKAITDVAKMRGRTEETIFEHLESLRALGKLSTQDIAHLSFGSEQDIAKIHDTFRALGTDKLSPVFEKLAGIYSYKKLRIARLMFNEKFIQEIPPLFNLKKVREKYPNAYLSWNETQDEKLRELFTKGSTIADLAKAFNRTKRAIRLRLTKLGL